jgi:hypothetical protein
MNPVIAFTPAPQPFSFGREQGISLRALRLAP